MIERNGVYYMIGLTQATIQRGPRTRIYPGITQATIQRGPRTRIYPGICFFNVHIHLKNV